MTELPYAKKSLGQHWLTDDEYLDAMCDAAHVGLEDTILEIGPGLGTLTRKLVERAKQVIAVEFDEALAAQLPARVPADNLTIMQEDILRVDLTQLPAGYKVVANIPYYLTSNLIRMLSESTNAPRMASILVQKEVAERVAAPAGAMSLLSVTAQWYWDVSLGTVVKAAYFTPPPKVDSQILCLTYPSAPRFDERYAKAVFRLAKAGFSERRKTLLNSLSGGLHEDKETVKKALASAHIDDGLRAQNLSLVQWQLLAQAFEDV